MPQVEHVPAASHRLGYSMATVTVALAALCALFDVDIGLHLRDVDIVDVTKYFIYLYIQRHPQ